jgi:uncharacterized protein with PIN domain
MGLIENQNKSNSENLTFGRFRLAEISKDDIINSEYDKLFNKNYRKPSKLKQYYKNYRFLNIAIQLWQKDYYRFLEAQNLLEIENMKLINLNNKEIKKIEIIRNDEIKKEIMPCPKCNKNMDLVNRELWDFDKSWNNRDMELYACSDCDKDALAKHLNYLKSAYGNK